MERKGEQMIGLVVKLEGKHRCALTAKVHDRLFQKRESEVVAGESIVTEDLAREGFSRSGRTSLDRTGKEVGIKLGRYDKMCQQKECKRWQKTGKV